MKASLLPYKAFLFDLNGTMIDDMGYHVVAWTDILNNELKAGLSYEQVKAQMYGKNDELLERVFGEARFSPEEMLTISMEKERRYQQAFFPELKLIAGLGELLESAREERVRMAIGSAAIPFNIDFVLDNLQLRHYFETIVSADDVEISKPHPETYLECAARLALEPGDCVVFEDAPKGVEAALNAGMDCVVLTTLHGREDFGNYPNIIRFITDYNQL
ncbi:HAD family hydrolase [Flavihumibacter stibioxidans]|uniref:Haloacid dehalogenase n=1 Tax=Flavihumibacter stibioxidans TaxID=1834163 RepID=A0ABR7M8V3_9BACT|nr:HAD family phosphatase [Flavihumibacter stibioxidans]MBC6491449.1 haloacid dehalogenase [Flavihumibacter stibioxidans]